MFKLIRYRFQAYKKMIEYNAKLQGNNPAVKGIFFKFTNG